MVGRVSTVVRVLTKFSASTAVQEQYIAVRRFIAHCNVLKGMSVIQGCSCRNLRKFWEAGRVNLPAKLLLTVFLKANWRHMGGWRYS